jgi:hypothetical protein
MNPTIEQGEAGGLEQHQGRLIQRVPSRAGLENEINDDLISPAASADPSLGLKPRSL